MSDKIPVGTMMPYLGAFNAPTLKQLEGDGWLPCDGSAVDRGRYDQLFHLVDTQYGAGDGRTTFNLPNLTGKVLIGAGGGGFALHSTVGSADHSLSGNEMPTHHHPQPPHSHVWIRHGGGADIHAGGSYSSEVRNKQGNWVGLGDPTAQLPQGAGYVTDDAGGDDTSNAVSGANGTPFSLIQPSSCVNFIVRHK